MDPCSAESWSLLVCFIILLLLVTWFSIRQVRKELTLKSKYGDLCTSDIGVHKTKTLVTILAWSFIASLLGNTLGLGGGFILNPV